ASQIQRCETQLNGFFREVLSGVSTDLTRRMLPNKWSAHENLAHLARYHEVFLQRINRILNEDKPVFGRYRAEDDPEWEFWRQRSHRDLLDRLATMREQLVLRLKSLSDQDFQRGGVHPKFGEIQLSQWFEFFLVHEGHHLYLIFQQVRMLQQPASGD
ncbi:MAG TPA: DinB family protein, partial [Candidatus Acidoferrales bacterium]|nr:DinB family protein [Candidatus Acidoferrales bacterium]